MKSTVKSVKANPVLYNISILSLTENLNGNKPQNYTCLDQKTYLKWKWFSRSLAIIAFHKFYCTLKQLCYYWNVVKCFLVDLAFFFFSRVFSPAMIRSDRFCAGILLISFWIPILFYSGKKFNFLFHQFYAINNNKFK